MSDEEFIKQFRKDFGLELRLNKHSGWYEVISPTGHPLCTIELQAGYRAYFVHGEELCGLPSDEVPNE